MTYDQLWSLLKKSAVITGVGGACALIGGVEGAISACTGAGILNDTVKEAATLGASGVATLGLVEGFVLGGLAVNGFFGSYEQMKSKGFSTAKDRIFGYVGYTANQILGGVTAGLFLKMFGSNIPFGNLVADVALGATITGIVITPAVTYLAAKMLDAAYYATNGVEESSTRLLAP